MKLPAALKILGLGPEDDPRSNLDEFKNARETIAAMVRSAPNETLAARYQQGLIEFDQALAAVQEHLEASGLACPPLPSKAIEQAVIEPSLADSDEFAMADSPPGRGLSYFAWFLVFLTGALGGGWIFVKNEQAKEDRRLIRTAFLERQGFILVENRRWQDAANAFSEIEQLSPGSDLAQRGRRSIEAGMIEEQTQFVGYWTGQAIAELEAGRLDEAVAAARQVLDKFPNEKEATALLERIATARISQSRATTLSAAREALDQRKWNLAISTVQKILATTPDDPDAKSIFTDATTAIEKASVDQAKATELLKLAIARDQGQFDQQALDWLREAKSLAPENQEITSRLEKLSSYTRTLRVPGDFATPEEALADAHPNDRIVLGAGTWKGPLLINTTVELQGVGFNETRIECSPDQGSAITIGPDARGARVSGITFRHESFAAGPDRYSAALVRGGSATFVDCHFTNASGHGLAVIEGAQATVSRCRFADNGWNGIAAIGNGSTLEVRDSESLNNFEHGIESWDGAAVILINNRCEANSRNGIHADNKLASATIEGNQLIANREFGLVLDSAGSGRISGNTARSNLLGGLVIRKGAANLPVTANQATLNQGPGLVLEKGLTPASYTNNSSSKNSGQQILTAADLTTPEETVVDPAPASPLSEP
jgi:parallel beta-helix repeat protein